MTWKVQVNRAIADTDTGELMVSWIFEVKANQCLSDSLKSEINNLLLNHSKAFEKSIEERINPKRKEE